MIPISLYIHIPWCVRKCPYCDFNSHESKTARPEKEYIRALLVDLEHDLALTHHDNRLIQTIFIGGGTPSLLSADSYAELFSGIQQHLTWAHDIEITLEANPGTIERGRFQEYHSVGINRLSLGIQSFNPDHLQRLGRIHDDKQAHQAIEEAQQAGFKELNIDLMHGLPQQSLQEALADLQQALIYQPSHLSWYQLTIEPNTAFYRRKPVLPSDNLLAEIETQGFDLLQKNAYQRYEISAFCKAGSQAKHNLNYWLFGDYYGIGAGAHGKISCHLPNQVLRTEKYRQPKDYLNPDKAYLSKTTALDSDALIFEFMLNACRLEQAIAFDLFSQRTGLLIDHLMPLLKTAAAKGLIEIGPAAWQVTPLGRRFTNDLQAIFLR